MTIRSFIALSVPQEASNQLGDLAAKMSYQDKSGALRWVDQENYHITLAFLGQQHQEDLETLADKLDETLLQTEFSSTVAAVSPFPENKPKLMAALVDKTDDLMNLHRQVISSVNATGLIIDKRKFIPHITLARYRHSKNEFAGGIPANVDCPLFFDEVVLYESVLTSSGAEYEPIYRFPLDLIDYDQSYVATD